MLGTKHHTNLNASVLVNVLDGDLSRFFSWIDMSFKMLSKD
jgi:hypothetical protein